MSANCWKLQQASCGRGLILTRLGEVAPVGLPRILSPSASGVGRTCSPFQRSSVHRVTPVTRSIGPRSSLRWASRLSYSNNKYLESACGIKRVERSHRYIGTSVHRYIGTSVHRASFFVGRSSFIGGGETLGAARSVDVGFSVVSVASVSRCVPVLSDYSLGLCAIASTISDNNHTIFQARRTVY